MTSYHIFAQNRANAGPSLFGSSMRLRIRRFAPVVLALTTLSTLASTNHARGQAPAKVAPGSSKVAGSVSGAGSGAILNYQFKPGDKTHFKVSALFDGHFPPFAQPGSDPVHFKAVLGYTATVLKVDGEGVTVEFVVNGREMYLFKNEVAEEAKVDLNSEDVAVLDGLTSLEDTQKALNATAVMRPDGSVVRIVSKSSVKVPFDVGFDIRKLFLMMLPVTFPNRPVKAGDNWIGTDGLLGSKAGKTEYQDRIDDMTTSGNSTVYRVSQSAKSVVEDKLDKNGASTTKDDAVYRLLDGKVDLKTETTFVVPQTPVPTKGATTDKPNGNKPANPASANGPRVVMGQVNSVHILMNAAINRKRIKIDPDQPEIPENDPMDVRARMTVTRASGPLVASIDVPKGAGVKTPSGSDNAGDKNGKTGKTGNKDSKKDTKKDSKKDSKKEGKIGKSGNNAGDTGK